MKKIIQIYLETCLTSELTWGAIFFETPGRESARSATNVRTDNKTRTLYSGVNIQ